MASSKKLTDQRKVNVRRMYAFNIPCKEAAKALGLAYPLVRGYYNTLIEMGVYRVSAEELVAQPLQQIAA